MTTSSSKPKKPDMSSPVHIGMAAKGRDETNYDEEVDEWSPGRNLEGSHPGCRGFLDSKISEVENEMYEASEESSR